MGPRQSVFNAFALAWAGLGTTPAVGQAQDAGFKGFASAPAEAPSAAVAQACQITKGENGSWSVRVAVGEVVSFGDLKIRVADWDAGHYQWIVIDEKVPNADPILGLRLETKQSARVAACHQAEVTITYDYGVASGADNHDALWGPIIRVSVF